MKKMKWNTKQVEEIASIKNYEGWEIYDLERMLLRGSSSEMLVNALTAFLSRGFCILHYTRSFSDDTLRICIEL